MKIDEITKDTKGLFIYQETIMKICHEIAGFSLSEAEKIRKLISKSKGAEELDKYQKLFVKGCSKNNIEKEDAEALWNSIRESGAYLFNKSHAVAYSGISYQTAWLKTYYPKEFLAALMRHETGEQMMQAIEELRELGCKVKTPDINFSQEKTFINSDETVIMGLLDIDQVGEKAVEDIINKQPFESFDDFMHRRDTRVTNIRVIRNLILAGAFDSFKRRDELYYYVSPDETPKVWDDNTMWIKQMEVLDMPPEVPIITLYDDPFDFIDSTKISEIDWNDISDEIYVKGVITSIKVKPGYGFLNLNDSSGLVNVLLSEEVLERFKRVVEEGTGTPILVKAHMVNNKKRLYADMILPFEGYDVYENEIKYVQGIREQELEEIKNYIKPSSKVGIVVSSNYFKSKKGNKGTRITFTDGENLMSFDKNLPRPILAGDILEYKISKMPFINVLGVM